MVPGFRKSILYLEKVISFFQDSHDEYDKSTVLNCNIVFLFGCQFTKGLIIKHDRNIY